jgi:hypothetical protein
MATRPRCGYLAVLALAACGPRENCSLRPDVLRAKQRLAMVQLQWTPDTLAIASGDSLVWQPFGRDDRLVFSGALPAPRDTVGTLNGNRVAIRRLEYRGGLVLDTKPADATADEARVATPRLGPAPQALVRADIATARVHLARGIAVGMPRDRFLDVLFQGLGPAERRCLARCRTVVLADPTGEVIEQHYTFVHDTLAAVHLFKPGWQD